MTAYNPIQTEKLGFYDLMNYSTNPFPCHIFRGIGYSQYELVPSAYRRGKHSGLEKLKKYVVNYSYFNDKVLYNVKEPRIDQLELITLSIFYNISNNQGLDLPSDIQPSINVILDSINTDSYYKFNNINWMNHRSWKNIASLAQHFGIPTRLLDWTTDFNTALYFAVTSAIKEIDNHKKTDCFSIWIMNTHLMSKCVPKIRFVKTPYSKNSNINAQSGLFTVIDSANAEDHYISLEKHVKIGYDNNNVSDGFLNLHGYEPILKRIDIEYSLIPEIFSNLMHRKIDSNRFFPGFEGVVKTMNDYNNFEMMDNL